MCVQSATYGILSPSERPSLSLLAEVRQYVNTSEGEKPR